MKYVDMHLHTIYSDGIETPENLVGRAKKNGLGIISITDHDTFQGYLETKDLAKMRNIDLVSGVEISTREGHILGFGFNPENEEIDRMLKQSRELQREMTEERVGLLLCEGIPINMNKVERMFPDCALGKYHLIKTLANDGECAKYFAKKGIYHEHRIYAHTIGSRAVAGRITKRIELEALDAMEVIKSAGGISILAHPSKNGKTLRDFKKILQKIDGIEIQPRFRVYMSDFIEYARANGLFVTYGSDLHGQALKSAMLGKGDNVLEKRVLDRLGIKG